MAPSAEEAKAKVKSFLEKMSLPFRDVTARYERKFFGEALILTVHGWDVTLPRQWWNYVQAEANNAGAQVEAK